MHKQKITKLSKLQKIILVHIWIKFKFAYSKLFIHINSLIHNFTHKSENINFIIFGCSSPFSSRCQLLFLWRLFPDSRKHLQSKPVVAVFATHTIVTGTNEHNFLFKIISFFNENVVCNIFSENTFLYIYMQKKKFSRIFYYNFIPILLRFRLKFGAKS